MTDVKRYTLPPPARMLPDRDGMWVLGMDYDALAELLRDIYRNAQVDWCDPAWSAWCDRMCELLPDLTTPKGGGK